MSAAPKQCHYFTLWNKRPSCIKTHVITDNCKKIRREHQLFDSTCEQKLQRPQLLQKHNVGMTTALPDTSWKTATPLMHSCNAAMLTLHSLAHSVLILMRCFWGRRDQWCVFCTPLAVCFTHCSQPALNLANFEATVAAKWTLAFFFP